LVESESKTNKNNFSLGIKDSLMQESELSFDPFYLEIPLELGEFCTRKRTIIDRHPNPQHNPQKEEPSLENLSLSHLDLSLMTWATSPVLFHSALKEMQSSIIKQRGGHPRGNPVVAHPLDRRLQPHAGQRLDVIAASQDARLKAKLLASKPTNPTQEC